MSCNPTSHGLLKSWSVPWSLIATASLPVNSCRATPIHFWLLMPYRIVLPHHWCTSPLPVHNPIIVQHERLYLKLCLRVTYLLDANVNYICHLNFCPCHHSSFGVGQWETNYCKKKIRRKDVFKIGHATSLGIPTGTCESTCGKHVKTPGSGRIWTCGSKSRSPLWKNDKRLAGF